MFGDGILKAVIDFGRVDGSPVAAAELNGAHASYTVADCRE